MADEHDDEVAAVAADPAHRLTADAPTVDGDAAGSAPRDEEHAEMRAALDQIEAALDEAAAAIARMG